MDTEQEFLHKFSRPKQGKTLIVGSHVYGGRTDRRPVYKNAIGVDQIGGPGVDIVLDLEESLPIDLGTFDHLECISVLEHSKRPWLLAANLERLMNTGSTIWLSVPFVWRVHSYPSDYWRFTAEAIRILFPNIDWAALNYSGSKLRSEADKVKSKTVDGFPFFERTQVLGFGVKV